MPWERDHVKKTDCDVELYALMNEQNVMVTHWVWQCLKRHRFPFTAEWLPGTELNTLILDLGGVFISLLAALQIFQISRDAFAGHPHFADQSYVKYIRVRISLSSLSGLKVILEVVHDQGQ